MAPFQYAADDSREDDSALRDPNADPAISELVSPALDSDLGFVTGRRPSDSDHDPGPDQAGFLFSSFEDLYSLGHDVVPSPSPPPPMMSPNEQMPSMPFTFTHGHRQVTPSTDSPTSNSSSSVANLVMRNVSSRKRKSADSIFSVSDSVPLGKSFGIIGQELQRRWGRSSNSNWEQNTNDTVSGMSKLDMESADVSPRSSLTSSVSDNQYGLPGVSIPNFVHQDSGVSISSLSRKASYISMVLTCLK